MKRARCRSCRSVGEPLDGHGFCLDLVACLQRKQRRWLDPDLADWQLTDFELAQRRATRTEPTKPIPPPPTGRTSNRPRSAGKPKVPTDKIPTEQELRRWAQACPLWKWRAKHRISRPMMAAMMEVGATTIWLWEHGSSVPNPTHMDRLVTLLGPETIVRWVRWMDKRPGWGVGQQ